MNMQKNNEVYGVYVCVDCELEYTIDVREAEFYHNKGFDLPKRCPECRKIRRQNKVDAMRK